MIELIASDYVKDHTGIVEIDDEENYIDVEMEDMVYDDVDDEDDE